MGQTIQKAMVECIWLEEGSPEASCREELDQQMSWEGPVTKAASELKIKKGLPCGIGGRKVLLVSHTRLDLPKIPPPEIILTLV